MPSLHTPCPTHLFFIPRPSSIIQQSNEQFYAIVVPSPTPFDLPNPIESGRSNLQQIPYLGSSTRKSDWILSFPRQIVAVHLGSPGVTRPLFLLTSGSSRCYIWGKIILASHSRLTPFNFSLFAIQSSCSCESTELAWIRLKPMPQGIVSQLSEPRHPTAEVQWEALSL